MLVKIESDAYFINKRIKEISKDYFIVFNTKSQHFEIHNKRQVDNTYCLGLPFCELDERTIDFVQKTRIENINKLIEEIEKQNQKIEMNNQNSVLEKIKEVLI